MADEMPSIRPASYDKKVGLVLQGGGALSEEITIRPEHIMASGALPPGFPPVETVSNIGMEDCSPTHRCNT